LPNMAAAFNEKHGLSNHRRSAFLLLWLALVVVLFSLREILAPFVGAILIAYLLAPLVKNICAKKIHGVIAPRWTAVIFIYALFFGTLWLFGTLAIPKIGAEFGKLAKESETFFQELTPEKIGDYTHSVANWLEESGLPVRITAPSVPSTPLEQSSAFVVDLRDTIRNSIAELTSTLQQGLVSLLKVGPKFVVVAFRKVFMTFLIFMVAAFLLMDPSRPLAFLRSLFPSRFQNVFDEFLVQADRGLAGVVRGQVLICLINGILTFIGLYFVIGVKYSFLLSTLAMVMSLIPIFGSILSSVPIVAVALTDGWSSGFGALAWIIGIHLLEANFLNPKIIGTAARIHPALVVFVLVAGEHFYGVVGALFSVPITSLILTAFSMTHQRVMRWGDEASDTTCPAKEEGIP
jgi:putative heme transporter